MNSQTVEDYLKQIHSLARRGSRRSRGEGLVSIGELAENLKVVPGTVTAMVKRLSDRKLVHYERYGGVKLTARGEKAAAHVLRRHRLLETFLVQTLRMDWSEVHEEAERLEHAVSDRLLQQLDEFLGFPATDPHGDPIPRDDATPQRTGAARLCDLEEGDHATIVRVMDQNQPFLISIGRRGLKPGAEVTVRTTDRDVGLMTLRVKGSRLPVPVSIGVAEKLEVERGTEARRH